MRYRLSTLLVAMVWVGLVCLALRSPNQWWSSGMFAVLVLVMLTAVLVAIYRPGQWRAMAIGFLIFSGGYLAVQRNYFPANGQDLRLPDDQLIWWSFITLQGDWDPTPDSFGAQQIAQQRLSAFQGICRSSLAIVVGVVGGIIAQVLWHTRPAEKPPAAPLSG
jgi:hypothetical protein